MATPDSEDFVQYWGIFDHGRSCSSAFIIHRCTKTPFLTLYCCMAFSRFVTQVTLLNKSASAIASSQEPICSCTNSPCLRHGLRPPSRVHAFLQMPLLREILLTIHGRKLALIARPPTPDNPFFPPITPHSSHSPCNKPSARYHSTAPQSSLPRPSCPPLPLSSPSRAACSQSDSPVRPSLL